ncbi:MAG: DUF99 family protein [Deltaproteobacteria bacterium]|nr:DUF99 family protein [Deltaproteobacteria bacterium]
MAAPITNVIGFDDGPFDKQRRGGAVLLVGAVCARTRLDGVVSGRVRHDGRNATQRMIELVRGSQFDEYVRAVLLGGIAVAGFNVVDIRALHAALERPVVVVARRPPRYAMIREALSRVPGGDRKWALIQAAGPMEPLGGIYVQRVGISPADTAAMLEATALHGKLPEPVRAAHLIAGGVVRGTSRGRA